jgi:hypothetical protein
MLKVTTPPPGAATLETFVCSGCGSGPNAVIGQDPSVAGGGPVPGDPSKAIGGVVGAIWHAGDGPGFAAAIATDWTTPWFTTTVALKGSKMPLPRPCST